AVYLRLAAQIRTATGRLQPAWRPHLPLPLPTTARSGGNALLLRSWDSGHAARHGRDASGARSNQDPYRSGKAPFWKTPDHGFARSRTAAFEPAGLAGKPIHQKDPENECVLLPSSRWDAVGSSRTHPGDPHEPASP